MSASLVEVVPSMDVWRCVLEDSGAPSVPTAGQLKQLTSPVDSSASNQLVSGESTCLKILLRQGHVDQLLVVRGPA